VAGRLELQCRFGAAVAGAKTMEQRCAEFKDQKLAGHTPLPLNDEIADEFERIVTSARKESV